MKWYRVTKKIHGHYYDYWQKTYRVGKQVKTLNQYIGRSDRVFAAALEPPPTLPFGLDKGRYFCTRCETQTDRVDWEGKCYACEPSESNRPSRPLPATAGTFTHPVIKTSSKKD